MRRRSSIARIPRERRPEPLRKAEAPPAKRPGPEALQLQRAAGNAATAALLAGRGKGTGAEEMLRGHSPLGRVDGAAVAAVAPPAAAPKSQDVTVAPIAAPTDLGRGGFSWKVWFNLAAPAAEAGWVVQEIDVTTSVRERGAAASDDLHFHFWEAWEVKKGKKATVYQDEGRDDNDDLYYTAPRAEGSKGSDVTTGKVRFLEGPLPADFKQNNPETLAGVLFSSTSAPPGWSGSMAAHDLAVTWDDTVVPSKTDIKPKP